MRMEQLRENSALMNPWNERCSPKNTVNYLDGFDKRRLSAAALCGGTVKNATVGRVLSPSPHHEPNATQDRSCSWSLEAPKDQRLHLHLERLVLGPTDR